MADDLVRQRTTTTFARVHGDELSAQAQHEAEKLNDDSIPRDLKTRAEAAIKLASEIGGAIDGLRTAPQNRGQDRQDRLVSPDHPDRPGLQDLLRSGLFN